MSLNLQRLRWLLVLLGFFSFVMIVGSTFARSSEGGAHGAFAQLQARAANSLDVHWNETIDVPDFLAGRTAADRIPYTPSAAERGNPVAIARGFLDENRALFKLTSTADNFQLLRVEADKQLGYAHVRMSQTYKGIPVWGKQLVVHIDKGDQIVAINGHYLPDINVPTKASISQADAERVALKDLLETQLDADERATVNTELLHDKTQLMVYVDEKGKATLTWNVIILTDSPLGQWMYFVHAGRPAVVHAFDSAEHVKQRRTFTADNKTNIPGRILIEEGERSKDDIANAAHDGAGKVYDYYMNTFKRDAIDDQGSTMVSTVHYGSSAQDAQNAAWISQRQQMIYGDGGTIFKPLALGLDVVGHEFTHGVTDSTSQLIYQGQSGALNESYSDVFGAMIDRANWTIGETVIKSPPYPVPYLRNMEDPSAGGRYNPSDPLRSMGQPSHMREYANLPFSRQSDNGGVHVNSGIPNRVAYLIGTAIGKEKLEQIYYRTLTQYLTPDSDFAAAARASIQAATELYGATEANAVRNAWTQVGLNLSGTNNPPSAQTPTPRPSPSPTPSRRGTPTPPPQTSNGCTNLIVNGGFETDAGWVEVTASHSAIMDPELPHTGSRSAWLGGQDEESLQYIYQDVNIPANATSVKLNYWRQVHEEKKSNSAEDARFWTVIARTNGDVLATVEQFVSSQGDDTWAQRQFDISQFAGKQLRLAYIAENPQGNISSYFVDDVEMLACTTGTPSQPTPSAKDSVFVQGYVRNTNTGRGIEGALFFVLKPGLSATEAAADDAVTDDEVLTLGTSDATGFYQTESAVPRGQNYSVIVIARGYRAILADDGLKIPANASNPVKINASMRPSR